MWTAVHVANAYFPSAQDAIKQLIVDRFDIAEAAKNSASPVSVDTVNDSQSNKRAATNGTDGTDPSASPEPVKKKTKRSASTEDTDAKLAAQLQAHENSLARSRTTRGGRDKSKVTKKKAPRKKSTKKVGADDDSEVDVSGDSGAPKRKAGGGFQKPFLLSPTLSELCGETQVQSIYAQTFLFVIKSTNIPSFPDHKWSKSYGSTSRPMSFRILRTNAKSSAMKR